MIDYSLPVARRTRQGQALIFKQYNEKKKGKEKKEKKENNGVESASSSKLSRANCKIETESETVAVSDSSVEEIDVNDWGEEGSDVGEESMRLKNNENSNMGFEGMDHVDEIVVDDSEDDEVVFLGEGDMNCSGLKSGAERGAGVVCIDLDDEDVLSGEDVSDPSGLISDGRRDRDEMVPSLTRKGESSCLNFDDRKSSGVVGRTLKRNEVEDGGDDAAAWDESYGSEKNKDEHGDDNVVLDGLRRNEDDDGGGNDVTVDSVGSETSLESSSSEEASDDEDYKVEKLERYGDFQQLSSDSRVEEEEKEEDAEEREIMKRGSHKRGRPNGVDVGLKRRKYGLNILFDSENEDEYEDGGADAVAWDESYGSERSKDEHGDDNVVLDGLRRNEKEDDDGGGNDVSVDSVGSETSLESSSSEEGSDDEDDEVEKLESCGESSSSEEASDDEDYKVEKLERCGDFQQLSSDSRVEEEEKEEDAEEREIMKRGSHKRGRPNGVDVGLKRRKYGLDILRDSENEEDNINDDKDCSVNTSHERYCVAQRTRSHFTAKLGKKKKKKKMEVGTFSHPLCIDEEEVESSSGHDDSDDSGDDIVGSEKFGSNYENEDNFSDEETYHGGKKTVSCSGKLKTNQGYDDEGVRKVHERDEGKLRMATKGKSINFVKNYNDLEILVDSILKKGEVPLEELESSKDDACKDENYSAVAKMPLPLKFTFGVGESNPSKKSEDQKEMDELWADFELAQSGKKTVSCSGKFNTNKGYDEECVQKVHERDEEKLRMADKGKSMDLVKNCNALKFPVDSILKKEEVPLEELESSKDDACKDENYSAVAKMPLPLKFTFGVGESNPSKKSEDQKEMDELWADFELALMCSEIGSVNSAKVDDEDSLPSENGVDRATLCHVGNHELILDEQVGLRCAFCSYVKMEIKYILPSFSTHHCGKSSWRDPGDEMNHSIFDDLRSQDSGCDSHSVCDQQAHAEATVWDIIPGIKSSMYPHQRDGFEFLWKNMAGGIYLDKLKNQTSGSGCIISHAPGTGKTRLTIVFLQTYMKLHPTCRPVIVAPVSMLLTWEEEFRKWKFDIPFHNLNQPKLSGKESLTKNMEDYISLKQGGHLDQIVIRSLKVHSWKMNSSILGISYKLFGQLTGTALFKKELLEVPGLIVLDEGHIPRNFKSRILKALSNIKTDKRIILSGTPFQNNFEELYNTLCLARPKFTSIKGKWESLTSPITEGTKDRLKCENLKKVRDMIDPFVHVHKGSILQEKLPGLRDSLVILQPTQLQKSLFDELGQHITRNHFKSDYFKSLISVHPTLLLKCGEEGFFFEKDKLKGLDHEAGVKTIFLLELIRLSKALNEKVLVFSQYLEPLTFVMNQLKFHFNWSEGNEVLYMHGQLEAKQRQSLINIFNDPTSEARVLLASIRACSEGINLVGASRVVLLDVVWNPSVERQAISRAHRLGQEKVVYVYHLIASKTNEEEKYCRQVEKDLLSELVFSSSGGSGDQHKISPLVSDDKILEEMVRHEKLKHIFEKIQQKDSKLIETFTI